MSPSLRNDGAAALRAGRAGREQLLDRPGEPGVGALGAEQVAEMADRLGRQELGAAGRAAEGRDRHAPGPLPADAPVGAERDHRLDPRLAPAGQPADLVDRLEGPAAQVVVVHADEPLLGRPEDHRLLASPAVRVAVHQRQLVDTGAPTPCSRATIAGLAAKTCWPVSHSGASAVNRPDSSTGLRTES